MNRSRPGRAWGFGLVACAHAGLLAWVWARPLALDPAGPRAAAVLMAQLLSAAEPAPAAADRLPMARPRTAPQPTAAAAEAEPARPEDSEARADVAASPHASVAAPTAAAASATAATVPQAASDTGPAPSAPPAVVSAEAPVPRPDAPRHTPADHAGCAQVPHPLALRERGIEGRVQLRVQVGSDGRARQVLLLGSSGWRLFDEAALAKARSCRFRPAFDGDTAVESWVEFPVRFALTQS